MMECETWIIALAGVILILAVVCWMGWKIEKERG